MRDEGRKRGDGKGRCEWRREGGKGKKGEAGEEKQWMGGNNGGKERTRLQIMDRGRK